MADNDPNRKFVRDEMAKARAIEDNVNDLLLEQNRQLLERNEELERRAAEYRGQATTHARELKELKDKIENYKSDRKEAEDIVEDLQNTNDACRQTIEQLKKEVLIARSQKDELEEQMKKANHNMKLHADLSATSNKKSTKYIGLKIKERESKEEVEKDRDQAIKDKQAALKKQSDAVKKLNEALAGLEDAENKIKGLEKQLGDKTDELNTFTRNSGDAFMRNMSQLSQLSNGIQGDRIRKLEDQTKTLEDQNKLLRNRVEDLKRQMRTRQQHPPPPPPPRRTSSIHATRVCMQPAPGHTETNTHQPSPPSDTSEQPSGNPTISDYLDHSIADGQEEKDSAGDGEEEKEEEKQPDEDEPPARHFLFSPPPIDPSQLLLQESDNKITGSPSGDPEKDPSGGSGQEFIHSDDSDSHRGDNHSVASSKNDDSKSESNDGNESEDSATLQSKSASIIGRALKRAWLRAKSQDAESENADSKDGDSKDGNESVPDSFVTTPVIANTDTATDPSALPGNPEQEPEEATAANGHNNSDTDSTGYAISLINARELRSGVVPSFVTSDAHTESDEGSVPDEHAPAAQAVLNDPHRVRLYHDRHYNSNRQDHNIAPAPRKRKSSAAMKSPASSSQKKRRSS